jgi:hypothetical protein
MSALEKPAERPGRIHGILRVVKTPLAILIAALMLAGVASAATRPALKLVSANDPMIVKGTGFRAKERVRVTVTITSPAATWRRVATATRRGTFQATIGLVPLGRCGGFNVSATGSKGSQAVLKHPPLPGCMP